MVNLCELKKWYCCAFFIYLGALLGLILVSKKNHASVNNSDCSSVCYLLNSTNSNWLNKYKRTSRSLFFLKNIIAIYEKLVALQRI